MLTTAQKEKLTQVFRIWDTSDNGFLELEDWETIAKRHAELDGFATDSPEYKEMLALFTAIWNVIRNFADTDRDQRVSLDEFLTYAEDEFGDVEEVAYDKLPDRQRGMFEVILKWTDRDEDGRIGYDDYASWLSAWLGHEVSPKQAFERLDADGDGYISIDEMRQHIAEFVLSDDPNAAGNRLFG